MSIYGNPVMMGGAGGNTIVSKTITSNGTYNASADNADGYDPVIVSVPAGGGLPSDYQEVEYLSIGSTRTYITVPYGPRAGDVISCASSQQDWTTPSSAAVCGIRNADNDTADGYRVNLCVQTSNGERKRLLYANVGQAHDYDDPTKIASNGTSVIYGPAISAGEIVYRKVVIDTTSYLRVLVYGKYSSTEYTVNGNLYGLTINDATGVAVMKLVPCYRVADSVCGFFDLCNRRFYTAVQGSFTPGPDAN